MEWWKKVKELGSGTSGTVYLAYSSGYSDDPVAVKTAYWDASPAVESLRREAGIFQHLAGAKNVLQCYGEDTSVENNKLTYNLLLEFAPLGNLEDLIDKNGPMSELQVARYARMMLRGLNEIHSRGLIHGDLKAANVLVFPGRTQGVNELKIADFGLAKFVSEGFVKNIPTLEGYSGKRYYNQGTALTASPESVRWGFGGCGYHGPCADVWSIGCIVYQMLTGKYIWELDWNMETLYDQILNGPIPIPANLSRDGVHFLKSCLTRNISLRWSAEQLLTHPFIVKNLGVNLMSENDGSNVVGEWISSMDMFSERLSDGELSRDSCARSRLNMEPTATCCREKAAIGAISSQLSQILV